MTEIGDLTDSATLDGSELTGHISGNARNFPIALFDARFAASITAGDVLTLLLTVDGAGSGLDADLLDGMSSAAFAAASDLSDHLSDTSDAHDASAISVLDSGANYTATDVEAALAEVMDALQAHEADTSDAHDASAISVADAGGNYTATEVEAALAEVMDALQAHEADSAGAHAATAISNAPAGNIAATTVQAAIDELDAEKQPLDSDLTTIAAANNGSVLAATTASFTTADETKLDGIEALADVTDAANVAAAGAHMSGGTDIPITDGGTGASTARGAAANLGTWYVLAASGVAQSHTGTITETTKATITVPAGAMGANGALRITWIWSANNDASSKATRVRFGGISGTIFLQDAMANVTGRRTQCEIHNRNAANSQVGFVLGGGTGGWSSTTSATPTVTASLDTTAAQDIVLTAELADTADTLVLEAYTVELFYQA